MTSGPARSAEPQAAGIIVRRLGRIEYRAAWEAMRRFTDTRTAGTPDELWLLEHPPVYTLGLNDRREPFVNPAGIAIVASDRGGQITYHGPGQLVVYALMDLRRRGWGVRPLVQALEQAVLDYLAGRGIEAERRAGMPGVYVNGRKIAQLGLRVRRGGSYHGLAFNAVMDLAPFRQIKPCGYTGLETIDLASLMDGTPVTLPEVEAGLLPHLLRNLGYNP